MIVYYSATGNSRFAAERIGKITGDEVVNLLPMLRGERRGPLYSDRPWVVVAPIYVENMAIHVADWLKSARLDGNRQIYFVFTTASTMGAAGRTARKIAGQKGLAYMGSAEVCMPTNYPVVFTVPEDDACRALIRKAVPVIEGAAGHIAAGEPIPEKPFPAVLTGLFRIVEYLFFRLCVRPRRFYASGLCVSCGQCARVCPKDNIHMRDGRPAWGAQCVHCMACVSACPKEAVEYGNRLKGMRRYRFPRDL